MSGGCRVLPNQRPFAKVSLLVRSPSQAIRSIRLFCFGSIGSVAIGSGFICLRGPSGRRFLFARRTFIYKSLTLDINRQRIVVGILWNEVFFSFVGSCTYRKLSI